MRKLVWGVVIVLVGLIPVVVVTATLEYHAEGNPNTLKGAGLGLAILGILLFALLYLLKTDRIKSPDWYIDSDFLLDDLARFQVQYFLPALFLCGFAVVGIMEGNASYAVTPGVLGVSLAAKGISNLLG